MMDNTETTPGRLENLYRERRRARWDPTINLGHILSASCSLVAALAFVLTAWFTLDKRTVILEEAKAYQLQRDLSQDQRMAEKFTDVQRALDKLDTNISELRRDVKAKP